jgi:hypothetical protein
MANLAGSAAVVSSAKIERSYDLRILISVAILIAGGLVALFAITATPAIDPIELGNMTFFP